MQNKVTVPDEPVSAADSGPREEVAKFVSRLRGQLSLLEGCLQGERLNWAIETATTIGELAAAAAQALKALQSAQAAVVPAIPSPATVINVTAEAASDSAAPAVVVKKQWTPPTAEQVQRSLDKMFAARFPNAVGDVGNLVTCSFNGHFLDLEKAQTLEAPLIWFIQRSHAILFQETNRDALKHLSNVTGYGLNVSHRNQRGQAVGILFHRRLKWLGQPIYHDNLCDIPGHPEWKDSLRPAVQRRVRDVTSGLELDFIDLHTKSNLGGPEATAPIRRLQFETFVGNLRAQEAAAPLGPLFIAGDMNAPIDRPETTEIEPLTAYGLSRVPNLQGRSTYFYKGEGKGQFDGFFTRGLEGKLGELWIPEPLETKGDRWFYSEFSDHLPAFVEILV
jgi:hypothetical protein